MKFIFNFIFYGIVFYLIWVFFPEAFQTLVSWASDVYAFLKGLVLFVVDKFRDMAKEQSAPSAAGLFLDSVQQIFKRF